MRVTRAQAEQNRAHIVATASRLFRERGYDGAGVAELMAAAGFTHGGFYQHFGSKAELIAEASAKRPLTGSGTFRGRGRRRVRRDLRLPGAPRRPR